MADFRTLVMRLMAANGKINGAEVKLLKKSLYVDGRITVDDIAFLSDLRTYLQKKDKKIGAKFESFYLKSLEVGLLGSGVVSANEVEKIGELVIPDKTIKSSAKKKFLDNLRKKATLVAPEFDGLYEHVKKSA
jgi:hypothetical protein